MDTLMPSHLLNPIIQYGFAGLSVILLGILVWLIRELLAVLKANNAVIAANNQIIGSVQMTAKDTLEVAIQCKDKLLERPCIAGFEVTRPK